MVTVGRMLNGVIDPFAATLSAFNMAILKANIAVKKPRIQNVHMQQLSTGSQVAIEESTDVTISRPGKTELTILGAMSADEADYDGDSCTFQYWSNDGVKHTAIYICGGTSTDEVACVDTTTGVAVTDFYDVVPDTAVFTQAVKGGQTLKIGVTGMGTPNITIEASDTTPDADNIHGVGDIYVRGHSDVVTLQSKATRIIFFTPWGEQFKAIASTVANATTEVRYLIATDAWVSTGIYVGKAYRIIKFVTDTVPAGGVYMLLTDTACGAVDGTSGDVFGMIEEAIKEMLTTYFFAAPNRITYLTGLFLDVPDVAANSIKFDINYTPFGHEHAVIEEHLVSGEQMHEHKLALRIEPDTDVYISLADIANASTPTVQVEYTYGQLTTAAAQAILVDGD